MTAAPNSLQRGRAARLARLAHNQEVGGSNPPRATIIQKPRQFGKTLQVRLAMLTRCLVDACGGLVAASLECDISKTQLQRACDPGHPYSLKASTIYHLEQACGQPILSRFLFRTTGAGQVTHEPDACPVAPPVELAIDLASEASDMAVLVYGTVRDGKVSPNEHLELTREAVDIDTVLRDLMQAIAPDTVHAIPLLEQPS